MLNSGRVRLASIGIGMIGLVHAEVLANLKECEYIAISDANPSMAKTAERLGASFYSDYREMIEHEALDGVVISVPNEEHAPWEVTVQNMGFISLLKNLLPPISTTLKTIVNSSERNMSIS